jgi:hypothetical protein
MSKLTHIEPTWANADVFIIGGGKSLESFDWSNLLSELTIGCNDAFMLGEKVCKISIFGDFKWWKKWKDNLIKFKGRVFTNCNQLQPLEEAHWLNILPRFQWGLDSNKGLAWNSNTGAAAIDLALQLGAKRIFLLGFDCKLIKGENNWHVNELDRPSARIFRRFEEGFGRLKTAINKYYPEVEIINISDISELKTFKKVPLTGFFESRKNEKADS